MSGLDNEEAVANSIVLANLNLGCWKEAPGAGESQVALGNAYLQQDDTL
jgi:hypothetical protein